MERRHPRNPPIRPLVLIVESHEDILALYALSLSAMGFDVIPAGDVAGALGRAWQAHPDIIVAELALGQLDGWELLRDLKQNPRTRDIPVVIMTADVGPAVRERVEREHGAACLSMPCLPQTLAIELRNVLDQQNSREHASTSQ